jgi:hypothetical protein
MKHIKVSTFRGLKPGQKFMVVNNSNSNNYLKDVVLTFNNNVNSGNAECTDCAAEAHFNTLNIRDIVLLIEDELTLEALEKEVVKLTAKIKAANRKIELCREYNLTVYDEKMLKIKYTLRSLYDTTTEEEKIAVLEEFLQKDE